MRRRYCIGICVVAGTAAFVLVATMREPRFQGRSLTAWLRDFESDRPEARWRAAEAVRQVGTNAVPFLIERLRYREPPLPPQWKLELQALLNKQSLVKFDIGRPANRRSQALAALDALGPEAKAGVPALEELLHENPPDHRAVLVIARLGPDAAPALTRALTNDQKVIRLGARACLEMLQKRSETLFPKTAQDAEFMRRTCEYNSKVLRMAFEEYKAQHPEQALPSGLNAIPPPSLPPDFDALQSIPTKAIGFETNMPGEFPQSVKSNPFE